MKKKVIALALGCTVAFGCAVGGTLAWLTDTTTEVKNTFTTSDISIELKESVDTGNNGAESFKMVPGHAIAKDPKVTVKANSEPCYVFVKIEEDGGVVTYTPAGETQSVETQWSDWLTYGIVDGWTPLVDENKDGKADNGIYYREVSTPTTDPYDIIYNDADSDNIEDEGEAKNTVGVKSSVTKEMMNAVTDETRPTLTFTAYAHQLYESNNTKFDVHKAWQTFDSSYVIPTTPTN